MLDKDNQLDQLNSRLQLLINEWARWATGSFEKSRRAESSTHKQGFMSNAVAHTVCMMQLENVVGDFPELFSPAVQEKS